MTPSVPRKSRFRPAPGTLSLVLVMLLYVGSHAFIDQLGPEPEQSGHASENTS